MANTGNSKKPNWQLNFDISPAPTVGRDGQTYWKAKAIAKRGDRTRAAP